MSNHPKADLRGLMDAWTAAGMTPAEVTVLTRLWCHTDPTGATWVSSAAVAEGLDVIPRRVRKVAAKAEELGLLTTERGRAQTMRRVFTPLDELRQHALDELTKAVEELHDDPPQSSLPPVDNQGQAVPPVPPAESQAVPGVPARRYHRYRPGGTTGTAEGNKKNTRSSKQQPPPVDKEPPDPDSALAQTVDEHLAAHLAHRGPDIRNATAYARSQRPRLLAVMSAGQDPEELWPTHDHDPAVRTGPDGTTERFYAGTGWVSEGAAP